MSNNLETLHATHYFASNDPNTGNDVPNSFIPQDDNAAGGLPSCVQLSINSRVMLIRNLNTQNGLVNGAMGYVEPFTRSLSGKIVSVNMLFDNHINDRKMLLKNYHKETIQYQLNNYTINLLSMDDT